MNNAELTVVKSSKNKSVKMLYILGSCLTMLGYLLSMLDMFDD